MERFFLLFLAIFIAIGCESTTKHRDWEKETQQKDTTAPVLALKGEKSVTIALDSNFVEPGYKAVDDIDGDISNSVKKEGSVDSSKVGKYRLTYSVKDSAGNSATTTREIIVTTMGNAKAGALAEALIEIYEFEQNGTLKLKWKETTSSSNELSKIGKFDTHAYELNSDSIYLYRAINGKDYDANSNGEKDSIYSINSGVVNAIVTSDSLIKAKNRFNITLLSEVAYELAQKSIKYNYSKDNLKRELNSIAKSLLAQDVNGDSTRDLQDIIEFTPSRDLSKLNSTLKANWFKYSDLIHKAKKPMLHLTQSLKNIPTYSFARSITKSIDNTKLYIADGESGITVIDKDTNRVVNNIKTLDFARKIVLSSDESIAYVADSKKGFSVVNLAAKKVVANIPTYDANETNTTEDFDARYVVLNSEKTVAYLAASKKGIFVIDISTPTNPKVIKRVATLDVAYNLKLLNDKTVLVADGKSGLLAIDLDSNKTLGKINTYGSANSVTISSDKTVAYIADGYKGVVLADISDIENISYMAHVDTPDFATRVILNNDESIAYVADKKSNIQIVDISNRDKPKTVNSISTPYRSYDLILSDDEQSAYIATGTNGVELVATNSVKNPAILRQIPTYYRAYKAKKDINNIYVAQGKAGLQVIDKNYNIITNLDTPGFAVDLAIEDNELYLADGYKGLQKIDISDSKNPTTLDTLSAGNFVSSVKLLPNSQYMLVSDGNKGVKLVDKRDLSVVDTLDLNGIKAGDITLKPNSKKAYIALGSSGAVVVDYARETIKQEATINLGYYIKNITIDKSDNKGYFIGDGNITVVDLTTNKKVNTINHKGYASGATLIEDKNLLLVANDTGAVEIIDLEKEDSLGSIECGDKIKDILVDGSIAYASSNTKGLCVIDLDLIFN